MIDRAIEKLTKEMMEAEDPFMQAIEEHLTGVCTTVSVAEKILRPDKSLKEACNMVRAEAKKNAKSGVGIVSDQEAYRIVGEYFGINQKQTEKNKPLNILDYI